MQTRRSSNSQWFDDRMKINHHVHIGVAVAVEDGLLVPVLKFADEQSLTQIGSAVKDFILRLRLPARSRNPNCLRVLQIDRR